MTDKENALNDISRMAKRVKLENLDEYIDPEERMEYVDTGPIAIEEERELEEEVPGDDVTDEMLQEDRVRTDSWMQYNKGLEQTGYSPADQVTPDNVDELAQEYVVETDSAGMQTNPVIIPGDPPVMYFLQTNVVVKAVNARTGEEFWTFRYEQPEDPDYDLFPRLRGVTAYEDKVYFGTPSMHLVAINRYTGEPEWESDGYLDEQREELEYAWRGYGFSDAPVAYDGKIYIGQVGGDVSRTGYTYALAFDAETGDIEWETKMAPEDQWVGDTWKFANASPWMSPAIDRETDTVFWNSGNPGPMLNPLVRPGPNQMTSGIVALDAQTGEVRWNDQMIPHDIWDYDGQFTPTVETMAVEGEERRVVMAEHKSGWVFVYDAETGRLLQRSEPFARQDGGFLEYTGAGEENSRIVWPGGAGASNWPPEGTSPDTGYRYVGANDISDEMWFNDEWEFDPETGNPDDTQGGELRAPEELGDEFEHAAYVRAVDLSNGDIAWESELDDVEPDWGGFEIYTGGTTPTGGGVVFHGSSGGHLYAFDAEDGEELWTNDTGERITAGPVVWEDDGLDHVAITSSDRVIVYTTEADPEDVEEEEEEEDEEEEEEEDIPEERRIELTGFTRGWQGELPSEIRGDENPTIELVDGERYEVLWENGDGDPHNFVVEDEGGDELVETDIVSQSGETQTVQFDATEELSVYYCRPHAGSMRGDIEVVEERGEGEVENDD